MQHPVPLLLSAAAAAIPVAAAAETADAKVLTCVKLWLPSVLCYWLLDGIPDAALLHVGSSAEQTQPFAVSGCNGDIMDRTSATQQIKLVTKPGIVSGSLGNSPHLGPYDLVIPPEPPVNHICLDIHGCKDTIALHERQPTAIQYALKRPPICYSATPGQHASAAAAAVPYRVPNGAMTPPPQEDER
jgi:hypothetical protein